MPVYNDNILPEYTSWVTNGTITSDGVLYGNAGTYAVWQFNTKDYSAGNYALVSCDGCAGVWFFNISYLDTETLKWCTETVRIPDTGLNLPVILQQAKTDAVIFRVDAKTSGHISPLSFQLIEQAIRSVDIEYASGTSKVNPPEEGWQTNPPAWQTGRFIWQRTATTFIDGHTEYSAPILIQNLSSAAIYEIEEQFYLSTSDEEPVGGEWSTEQPTWESSKYIWSRSKITWTDSTVTYSDSTISKALNEANERAEEAFEAVETLDTNLDAEGVFNRLTDNGQMQGLYIDNGNYYFNATYIKAGTLQVSDASNNLIFKADMTSKSVFLAGFTASKSKLYYGRTSLKDNKTGTYIGIDGMSTGYTNNIFMALTEGRLLGGFGSTEHGYISFNTYWNPTGEYGMRIASNSYLALHTPIVSVGDYAAPDGYGTVFVGCTKSFKCLHDDILDKYFVYGLQRDFVSNVVSDLQYSNGQFTWTNNTVLRNITFSTTTLGYTPVNFTKGLMTTQ